MRDLFFFLLGVITILVIDAIINWPDARDSFIEGWNDAGHQNKIEESK